MNASSFLIVDDHKGTREIIKEIIEVLLPGAKVELCVLSDDFQATIKDLEKEFTPNYIFCDVEVDLIHTSEAVGIEYITEFLVKFPNTQVITISSDNIYSKIALRAGAVRFIEKPIGVSVIKDFLEQQGLL